MPPARVHPAVGMSGGTARQRPHVSWRETPVTLSILLVSLGLHLAGVLSADLQRWLLDAGAQSYPAVAAGEWYRMVTAAFLHSHEGAGVVWHVGGNMFWVWLVGSQLERRMGSGPFGALYLSGAVAGGVTAHVLGLGGIGASDAVFALLGFWLPGVIHERNTPAGHQQLKAWAWFFAFMLTAPFWPGADPSQIGWQAHLGGWAAGVVLGGAWLAFPPRLGPAMRAAATGMLGSIPLLLLMAGLVAGETHVTPEVLHRAATSTWSEAQRADHLRRVFGPDVVAGNSRAAGITIDPRSFGVIDHPEGQPERAEPVELVEVLTAQHRAAARAANRAADRWYLIDQLGREWDPDELDAAEMEHGDLWLVPYVSDAEQTAAGIHMYVDFESGQPPVAMQARYLQVLVEELRAAGVTQAHIAPHPEELLLGRR
jgi:membrane associated rhomboid family serine protease